MLARCPDAASVARIISGHAAIRVEDGPCAPCDWSLCVCDRAACLTLNGETERYDDPCEVALFNRIVDRLSAVPAAPPGLNGHLR